MRVILRKTSCVDLQVASMGNAQNFFADIAQFCHGKQFEHLKQWPFFPMEKCNKLFPLLNFDWVEKCTGNLLITILNLIKCSIMWHGTKEIMANYS